MDVVYRGNVMVVVVDSVTGGRTRMQGGVHWTVGSASLHIEGSIKTSPEPPLPPARVPLFPMSPVSPANANQAASSLVYPLWVVLLKMTAGRPPSGERI
jgi:hypothetical protein